MLNDFGMEMILEREAFLYSNDKVPNSKIADRNYFGFGKVYLYLTGKIGRISSAFIYLQIDS